MPLSRERKTACMCRRTSCTCRRRFFSSAWASAKVVGPNQARRASASSSAWARTAQLVCCLASLTPAACKPASAMRRSSMGNAARSASPRFTISSNSVVSFAISIQSVLQSHARSAIVVVGLGAGNGGHDEFSASAYVFEVRLPSSRCFLALKGSVHGRRLRSARLARAPHQRKQ